jgi:signal transduction histidine kinase
VRGPTRGRSVGRAARVIALVVAIGLFPLAVGAALIRSNSAQDADRDLDRTLANDAAQQALGLEHYAARARSIMLLMANMPAFADFYRVPGTREERIERGGPVVERVHTALAYLEQLYPGSIGEACFIDRSGWENARVVHGDRAGPADLSNELKNAFVAHAFALRHGEVLQARPYVSPDTNEWVIANAALVPTSDGSKPAIVHFEVTLESFRQTAAAATPHRVFVVDARSGEIVIDSSLPQRIGAPLGRLDDTRLRVLRGRHGTGLVDAGGMRVAYKRLEAAGGSQNEWIVAVATDPRGGAGFGIGLGTLALLLGALLFVAVVVAARWLRLNASLDERQDALRASDHRYRELFEEAEEARLTLATQNDELLQLDRIKDEFVALVSHELRTPLTSIRGYLELLLDGSVGDLGGEQKQFLGVVERNAARLQSLVGDLLFFAQMETGQLELERGDVDLALVAAEAVESSRPHADENQIALALAVEPLPAIVGDRSRLGQLLDNLISNAIKFTAPGGTVDVRLRRDGDCAIIEIADTGMGIPAAEQERLFERFFRSSNVTAEAIQGTGLGLAISKAIAAGHGGRITFASAENEGTTFRIELPLERTIAEAA